MSNGEQPELTSQRSPVPALRDMIQGSRLSQAIYVAAKLGIADLLIDQSLPIDKLAEAVGADSSALYRVMRFLASLGVFHESPVGFFEMTSLAEPLRSDHERSLRNLAILYGEEWYWRPWGEILHSVKTGEPAFNHSHGMSLFDFLSQNDENALIFDAAMSNLSMQEVNAILAVYDFSFATCVVDVGGGQGLLLSAVLKRNPSMTGILFDLDHVVAGAQHVVSSEGVAERCSLVSGSFLESVPESGQLYLLKSVLHNWDDISAGTILKNCRQAIAQDGKLLIFERIISSDNKPSPAKHMDLAMLVALGGAERTMEEHRRLLEASGFELLDVTPTLAGLSIIEAIPA